MNVIQRKATRGSLQVRVSGGISVGAFGISIVVAHAKTFTQNFNEDVHNLVAIKTEDSLTKPPKEKMYRRASPAS